MNDSVASMFCGKDKCDKNKQYEIARMSDEDKNSEKQ